MAKANEDIFTRDVRVAIEQAAVDSVDQERYDVEEVIYHVLVNDKETGKTYMTTGICRGIPADSAVKILDYAKGQIK